MPTPEVSRADEVVVPALLRAARRTYGRAIHRSLAAAGFEDMPRNGPFVVGGMANHGASAGDLVRDLGVSKQATSQLVDTLVVRGYLSRRVHDDDRRRMTIELTDRGRAAGAAVRAGIDGVDAQLAAMVSAEELAAMRRGLMAIIELADDAD